MKRSSHFKRLAATALTMACLQGGALASTVFWGSEFNDLLFDSNANTLDTSFSFEIGTFGGFIPTYQNIDQWVANWKVFDRAFDPDANGWNALDQFFVGTVDHNTSGNSESPDANPLDVFVQGEKIYLWVYNSKALEDGSEWALVTDSVLAGNTASQWVIPDPLDPPGTSYELKLVDADDVVIGGVNGVQGEGGFNATPPGFSLQTAVVPEPGSGLLIFAAAAALLTRRASRRISRTTMA
ncbi:MAG: PEP-CTERM sorting domain-containing protein [Prosthecobacter sp.]